MNNIKIIGDKAFISNDICGWTLTRSQAAASLSGTGGCVVGHEPSPEYMAYLATLHSFAYGR